MKIKSLRIKCEIKQHINNNVLIPVEIHSGVMTPTTQLLIPYTATTNGINFATIKSYNYSPVYKKITNQKLNISLAYNGVSGNASVFTYMNWFQRQKLYLMRGDHLILNHGNFKWLIGGLLGFLFYLYTDKQDDKFSALNKTNQMQQEQIIKLQTELLLEKKVKH